MIEPNSIICGDAYELIKQIPDKSVDLIYTDIPYEYSLGGSSSKNDIAQKLRKRDQEIKDFSKGIDYSILDEFVRALKYIYIYIWCSKQQILPIMEYFKNCKVTPLVWCKTNPIPTNPWLNDVEYCLCIKEEGAPKYNCGYNLQSMWYQSGTNQGDKKLYVHPTIKPYELVKRHILHSSNPGDIILDPFMGSGTTCKVAKDTDRKYIGFEIDKKFYQIAKDRLENINAKGEVSLF